MRIREEKLNLLSKGIGRKIDDCQNKVLLNEF